MGDRHHERVLHRALREQRRIRLLLAEMELVLKRLSETQSELVHANGGGAFDLLRQEISDLGHELLAAVEIEGGDGDVAIALACDRRLDAEVSALASRRSKWEERLSSFVEAFSRANVTSTRTSRLCATFSELSDGLTSYLSDKMDALRSSLIASSRSVAATG